MTPDERYAALVKALLVETEATWTPAPDDGRRSFGAGALKIDGRIFAMLTDGRLVVKLPAGRVEELASAGEGARFDPGHGRIMREWLSLAPGSRVDWRGLAGEGLAFVRGASAANVARTTTKSAR